MWAKILSALAKDGDLEAAWEAWALETPGMSAMQNQVVYFLLMGPEYYVHALRFADVLYFLRGEELISAICNGNFSSYPPMTRNLEGKTFL